MTPRVPSATPAPSHPTHQLCCQCGEKQGEGRGIKGEKAKEMAGKGGGGGERKGEEEGEGDKGTREGGGRGLEERQGKGEDQE